VDTIARPQGSQHALQISIGLLQFHDHQLFLQEHAIQRQLRTLAEQLAEQTEGEALEKHERKIAELAITVRHLRSQLPDQLDDDDSEKRMAETRLRLVALTIELLHTRRFRDEQECAERLLARRMLVLWQDLKGLRQRQGFQATRARLQVSRRRLVS
jgi:DNA-binding transcriptional regulator GbsR (MarR family)